MTAGTTIIVGAGLAGVSAALALRREGFAQPIRLYSDEMDWPYDRPPLSKSFVEADGPLPTRLLSEADAVANAIDLIRGVRVASLDVGSQRIVLSDGTNDSYGTLILATGGTARALPFLAVDNERVLALRTLADARSIAAALARTHSVAVIGGGWLGLEVAAAATTLGRSVSVFETAPTLCARSLPREPADYLQRMHTERGVRVELRSSASFAHDEERIVARHLDGRIEDFDMAIIAAGLVPRTELARDAGIACDDGILTDGAGRTSVPGIYAIGDVARLRHDGMQQRLRLESWTNAATQGALVAQAICGGEPSYTAAPWFWSEQFGRIIQVAGLPQPDLALLSRDDGDGPLWRYGRNRQPACVIGIDRTREVRAASRLLTAALEAGSTPSHTTSEPERLLPNA
jgi:3-phenylpropionate/trans-cinnamate dioxygenase ferredoxin reductase component